MDDFLKYRNVIVNVLVIVVLGIVVKLVYSSYLEEEKRIHQESEAIVKKKDLIKEANQIKKKVEERKSRIFRGSMLQIKKTIESTALKSGIKIISLRPTKGKKEEEYTDVIFSLNVRGNYKQLVDFVEKLEGNYLIDFQNIDQKERQNGFSLRVKVFLEE